MFRKALVLSLMVVAVGLTAGCEGSDGNEPIAVEGNWLDSYGTSHVITDTLWTQNMGDYGVSTFLISVFDNSAGYAIAQNGADNSFNANLWSRFDWHFANDGILWYCQTAFSAETESAAIATTAANSADLDTGCNGFPWTALVAVVE